MSIPVARLDLGLILGVCLLTTSVAGEPPSVVSVMPSHGDIQVDPSLKAFRVIFDQDMDNTSFSFVGGGETFPEVTGQPKWLGPRMCVLQVNLQPGRVYRFGINGGRFTGFHNLKGEPAPPHPVVFATSGGEATLDEETNQASIVALRGAIENNYSYRDRMGLDWDALFADHAKAMRSATRPEEFALRASLLLAAAEDLHIGVGVGNVWLQPHAFTGQGNFNFGAVNQRLEDLAVPNDLVQHGHIGDDIGYVRVNSWNGNQAEAIKAAVDAYRFHSGRRGLIIDVRANGGGNEMLSRQLAGCFISESRVYSYHRFRNPDLPDGFTPMTARKFRPNRGAPIFEGEVVVLIGPVVCSSNESFVEMMRQAPRCTLIGMTTFGSSGNPQPHDLPNGVRVNLPSWQDFLADRTLLEGRGIVPDIEVITTLADFAGADPVFERAVRFLRQELGD